MYSTYLRILVGSYTKKKNQFFNKLVSVKIQIFNELFVFVYPGDFKND